MRSDEENIIVNKSLQFAVDIIRFSEKLENERKNVLAKQLLKS